MRGTQLLGDDTRDRGAHSQACEMRKVVQKLFGYTHAEFQRAFRKAASNPLDISLLTFKKRPFLLNNEWFSTPHFAPFRIGEVLSGHTYWTLHGWYCDQSKEAMNAFTQFVGDLFQEYVTDLLVRVYSRVTGDVRFYTEQDIIAASSNTFGGDRPPFDGLLHSHDSLVVFEITTESIGIPRTEIE